MYPYRIMQCTVASILVLILIFRFWPLPTDSIDEAIYHSRGQEVIAFEQITPTKQRAQKPPPPAPAIPVVVPDDVVLEEVLELEDSSLDLEYLTEVALDQADALAGSEHSFKAPEVMPKLLRYKVPTTPRAARRRGIRPEVVIEAFVDEKGRVLDARILDRFLLSEAGDEKEAVDKLEYGIEDMALDAALQCMFQPARQNGQPVKSYFIFTITFG